MSKYSNQTHPEDKANWLNRIIISWADGLVSLGNKSHWKQEFHPNVAQKDNLQQNSYRLKQYYKVLLMAESLNEKTSDKNFLMHAIGKAFKRSAIFTFCMLCVYMTMEFAIILLSYNILDLSDKYSKSKIQPEDMQMWGFIWRFLVLVILMIFRVLFLYNGNHEADRVGARAGTSIILMVYKKILKVSTLNPSSFNEGTIINNIQVDVNKISQSFAQMAYGVESVISCVFSIFLGFYLYGWVISILFGTSF